MQKCSNCNEVLSTDYVQCASAKACKLHFGNCAGMLESSWKKTANKNTWKCAPCRKETKGSNETDIVSAEELRAFMSEVKNQLQDVKGIKDMMEMMRDLKNTVEFMSNQYDQVIE